MDMAVADDSMRRLYLQQDWPRLAQAAERRARQQPQDGEAWCYWGVGELMQLKGGPDKLLQASLLGNAEAGLWLGVLQEFSAHPPGTVPVADFPSQIELAPLCHPLNQPGRLCDVCREMEDVRVPDVPPETSLEPVVVAELVLEQVHESVGVVVDRMCADHDRARRECHSDQVQLDRLDLLGCSAHGMGVPLDHLVISRRRFAIPLKSAHGDMHGAGDPRSEMPRAGDRLDLIHGLLQPHGRSLVRSEHDTHRPPAAFNRWGVTLVPTLPDQWHRFGKEQIESSHAPHISPKTLTTFQSRVVATTPPRSIRAFVSVASCEGCASHM